MASLAVAKFGGTSVATSHAFRTVADKIQRNDSARVIVISAPGKVKDQNDPSGKLERGPKITDRLIAMRDHGGLIESEVKAIENQFREIEEGIGMKALVSPRIRAEIEANLSNDPALDSIGEMWGAPAFAEYLEAKRGMKTKYLGPEEAGIIGIEQDGRWTVPEENYTEIRRRIIPFVEQGYRVVVPGFRCYDKDGGIHVFERGGSDYTGSTLAAALQAGLYQNFTDVDGIFCAEKEVSKTAPLIREMTHDELTELTLGGKFGVFQYAATIPVTEHRVVTQVLNTFNGNSEGTYILSQRGREGDGVTGLVHRGDYLGFTINMSGIANRVGFMHNLTGLFAEMVSRIEERKTGKTPEQARGISIEATSDVTNRVTLIVKQKDIRDAGISVGEILETIRNTFNPREIRTIELEAVAVVGEGLCYATNAISRIFNAVDKLSIPRPYFSGGEIAAKIFFLPGQGLQAAQAIYKEFFSPASE